MECKLEIVLIERNEIKYDNIESDLVLNELIYVSEIAKDKTIMKIRGDNHKLDN